MATFSFLADGLNVPNGSGLLFCGADGFGATVRVGYTQGRTFQSDPAGVGQGPEADNVQYLNAASGVLGQSGSGLPLQKIPNNQATVGVRFTHSSPVQVANARFIIYDGSSINNGPSGVSCYGAQIIHPDPTQSLTGSGGASWSLLAGTGVYLPLAPSPGVSGLYAGNGSNSTRPDTQHDWHIALSALPASVGTKYFGMWVDGEYF